MTTQFKINTTYQTRSICDYECIFSYEVVKRTAKTVTLSNGKTCRISVRDGVEEIKPDGSYSMCPVIKADKETA